MTAQRFSAASLDGGERLEYRYDAASAYFNALSALVNLGSFE